MDITAVFVFISSVLIVGLLSELAFRVTKVPNILWLMIFGALIGPVGKIADPKTIIPIIPAFSSLAIALILFDAGMHMKMGKALREIPRATLLGLLSFSLSALVAALATHIIFEFTLIESLVFGLIIGSTGSGTVASIMSKLNRERVATVLEIESLITYPLALIIPIVILQSMEKGAAIDAVTIAAMLAKSFSIAIAVGALAGVLVAILSRIVHNPVYSYSLSLASLLLVFSASQYLGGNGTIACFIFGIAMGNAKAVKLLLPGRTADKADEETKDFGSVTSFFVRAFFFVFLGMIADFGTPGYLIMGVVLSFLMLAARSIAAWLAIRSKEFTENDRELISYILPRGLASAVMAPLPSIQYGFAHLSPFTGIAFGVIISTALLTAYGTFRYGPGERHREKKQ